MALPWSIWPELEAMNCHTDNTTLSRWGYFISLGVNKVFLILILDMILTEELPLHIEYRDVKIFFCDVSDIGVKRPQTTGRKHDNGDSNNSETCWRYGQIIPLGDSRPNNSDSSRWEPPHFTTTVTIFNTFGINIQTKPALNTEFNSGVVCSRKQR